uniref:Uncharacterized protein n=1 Tax=Physcomitrium patens TaxID=3218 RepID=A0A2K1JMP0_PHYPA|nr:hypothetical protein PHYPA_017641 [Physcomitrium patens]
MLRNSPQALASWQRTSDYLLSAFSSLLWTSDYLLKILTSAVMKDLLGGAKLTHCASNIAQITTLYIIGEGPEYNVSVCVICLFFLMILVVIMGVCLG